MHIWINELKKENVFAKFSLLSVYNKLVCYPLLSVLDFA
jgi:hypothetical protein